MRFTSTTLSILQVYIDMSATVNDPGSTWPLDALTPPSLLHPSAINRSLVAKGRTHYDFQFDFECKVSDSDFHFS